MSRAGGVAPLGEAGETEQSVVGEQAVGLPEHEPDVLRTEHVENVGGDEAVEAGVAEGKAEGAVARLQLDVAEAVEPACGERVRARTDVHSGAASIGGEVSGEESLREGAGSVPELED